MAFFEVFQQPLSAPGWHPLSQGRFTSKKKALAKMRWSATTGIPKFAFIMRGKRHIASAKNVGWGRFEETKY